MMKVGDLVRFSHTTDKFHGAKGIIVRRVESSAYKQGFHYEVQTFDGHLLVALSFELERLENDVEREYLRKLSQKSKAALQDY